jgi:hypothetical protein
MDADLRRWKGFAAKSASGYTETVSNVQSRGLSPASNLRISAFICGLILVYLRGLVSPRGSFLRSLRSFAAIPIFSSLSCGISAVP